MADFRKWIFVLVAVALCAGLASAQSGTTFGCTATAAAPPQIRSEGFTELVGDITLVCQGGTILAAGAQIPTANFTIYLSNTVTSRLLASSGGASEALLLIDDPGGGTTPPSYGNTVAQTLCGFPLAGAGVNGCLEYVGNQGTTPASGAVLTAANNLGVPVSGAPNSGAPGANIFQGVVSGSSVTYYGIPVQPPATSGATRTFRITNVRINANQVTTVTPVTVNIAITGTAAVPINNSVLTVGYVSPSLSTSVRNALGSSSNTYLNLLQCLSYGTSTTPLAIETLRYSELQGSAFKWRGTNAQSPAVPNQNVPGQIYNNSESGFVFGGLGFSGYTAGYADWGTRLKAVFNNIPSGVTLYVSNNNLAPGDASQMPQLATSSFAALILSETSADTGANPGPNAGAPNGVLPSSFAPVVTNTGTSGGINLTALTNVGGSATAVWEVVNSLANSPENFDFEVFMVVTSSVPSGIPPAPSTMTVNMSYAPIPTQGAFTIAAGSVASNSLGIPRFADTSVATNALSFVICQTALLYPYVVEGYSGIDTGMAIANTTKDPFSTGNQTGYCTVNWYGANPPAVNPGYVGSAGYQTTVPTSSQLIQAGTTQGFATSVVAPNFLGYVIAVCNFQYAHGFAFISTLGLPSNGYAMGYLADVVNNGTIVRANAPAAENLNQ